MNNKKQYKFGKVWYLLKKSIHFAWYRHRLIIPPKALKKYVKSFYKSLRRGGTTSNLYYNQREYIRWLEKNNKVTSYKEFKYNPLISVIIPVYNVKRELLIECLESILNQTYKNFEICITDDCSTNNETINTLKEYEKKYNNIRVIYRKENGMISKASNDAIKIANGEFIALVDNDDTLDKDALYYIVEALNRNPDLDMIYTDEDKIDFNGKYIEPHFKPDFSPDTFLGLNYICHLTVLRKSLVDELKGFRSEYDGSQDYDLFLRITEITNRIFHISKILYHWRKTIDSTSGYSGNKSYAYMAGKRALEDALVRRNIKGKVFENPVISTYIVSYKHDNPLVSIIIPIKDKIEITKTCINSIINKTSYKNLEIIIIDNGSEEKETLEQLENYEKKYNFITVKRIESEFNYSYLNNEGVKVAKGDYILLLNNDIEVIDNNWLDEMVGYASQEHVGCVGIKLLYPDNKVQHAGIVLGNGGLAGHIYVSIGKNEAGLYGRLTMPYNYSAVTGACLLVNKDKYNSVNGLDENLKIALNDVDLNLKLLQAGFYNVCLSNIHMYHYESKSRGYEVTHQKYKRFKDEEKYLENKWGEYIKKDRFFSEFNF